MNRRTMPAKTPVKTSDCVSMVGAGYYCVAMNRFYPGLSHILDTIGICTSEASWGPPTCFNWTQDSDEDGVDCCLSSGDCECNFDC